ncbi:MAG TPA: M20/M25/M40 family metallo-hydrolase, partial [Phycisphaerae bacterium]|nr:M20/M25/M40 family metallo-hydrolase [Phycisphaerae bacterium]
MDRISAYLHDHQREHREWMTALCRIPSISTKPEHKDDCVAAARWTRDLCTRIGLKAEVHATGGHPLVYAEHCQAAGAPTFLVYGHLDVQPEGDLSLWDAGPFEPVEKDGLLVCRGAADDKGQVLIHLRAVAAWLAVLIRSPRAAWIALGGAVLGVINAHATALLEQDAAGVHADTTQLANERLGNRIVRQG